VCCEYVMIVLVDYEAAADGEGAPEAAEGKGLGELGGAKVHEVEAGWTVINLVRTRAWPTLLGKGFETYSDPPTMRIPAASLTLLRPPSQPTRYVPATYCFYPCSS
jgi:hypothetical protein